MVSASGIAVAIALTVCLLYLWMRPVTPPTSPPASDAATETSTEPATVPPPPAPGPTPLQASASATVASPAALPTSAYAESSGLDGDGRVLLAVGIISCRTAKCAARRQFLRTESWPSLLLAGAREGSGATAAMAEWARAVRFRFFVGFSLDGTETAAQTATARAEARALSAEAERYGDLTVLPMGTGDTFERLASKTRALIQWFDAADPDFAPADGYPRAGRDSRDRVHGRTVVNGQPVTDRRDGTLLEALSTAVPASGLPGAVPLRARYYLKTDDDVYVNVPALVQWLRAQPLYGTVDALDDAAPDAHAPPPRGIVAGNFWVGHRPIRDASQRWADPTFPADVFPPYPSGPGQCTAQSHDKQSRALTID
jgi:hypothetical protein